MMVRKEGRVNQDLLIHATHTHGERGFLPAAPERVVVTADLAATESTPTIMRVDPGLKPYLGKGGWLGGGGRGRGRGRGSGMRPRQREPGFVRGHLVALGSFIRWFGWGVVERHVKHVPSEPEDEGTEHDERSIVRRHLILRVVGRDGSVRSIT